MPQLARLLVELGIPEIKRPFLARECPLEIRLCFGGDTPSVCAFIEGDGTGCFALLVGQVRNLVDIEGLQQIQILLKSLYADGCTICSVTNHPFLFLDDAVMGDCSPDELGGCAHWRES